MTFRFFAYRFIVFRGDRTAAPHDVAEHDSAVQQHPEHQSSYPKLTTARS